RDTPLPDQIPDLVKKCLIGSQEAIRLLRETACCSLLPNYREYGVFRLALLIFGGEHARQPLTRQRVDTIAQDWIDVSQRVYGEKNSIVKSSQNPVLDRIRCEQAHNADGVLLAQSIEPTDALLHNHRIPGEVVVYQHRGKLKIDTLATDFRREQHANVSPRCK